MKKIEIIMDSEEHFRLIDRLLDEVLDLDPDKRQAFLEERCGGDRELKRRLEELLRAHEAAGNFMASPAIDLMAEAVAADSARELVGRSLGPYPVIEFLASGGMGAVYRARDPRLNREVAIKVLPRQFAASPDAVARFEREARAVAALSHPNVLSIHDFGGEGGILYAVMELLEGETLRQRIERSPLPAREAVEIAAAVSLGLAAAHAKGIVHRDLKPENIFLTKDGQTKILDFGLARIRPAQECGTPGRPQDSSRLTGTGTVLGTAGYMSPEQLRGEPADAPSDIFSFGCVLYEMLTGRPAFTRSSSAETAAAILRDPAPVLEDVALPYRIEAVLGRCLEKNPAERYASATELVPDLQDIRASAAKARGPKGKTQRLKWVLLLALIVLALASMPYLVSVLRRPPSPSAGIHGFQERDWILITDFDNQTGEDVFDKSLDTALKISVAQSRYVNVLSPSRIAESLRMMRRNPASAVNRDVGREIALRAGAKLVLLPAISKLPGIYLLSATFEDPLTGNILSSASVRVQQQEGILDGLDQLVRDSRRTLGESLEAISRQSRNLVKVTTSSLEALKQYSLGIEKHREANLDEARVYYEKALLLDPKFTAAASSLGMILYEHFDQERGKALLAEAVRDVEGLTERERYRILAFYTRAIENDLPKAIGYFEALTEMYPDDGVGHHNLGWFNTQLGNYQEAVSHYREAIRIDPSLMYTYDNLNRLFLYQLGEVTQALDLCRKQIERNSLHYPAYDNLGWAYIGTGDLERARIAFEKAVELNPRSSLDLFRLAHTLRLQKEYDRAAEVLRSIPRVDPESRIDYDLGIVYERMGRAAEARRHFVQHRANIEKDLRTTPRMEDRVILATVNARLGQASGLQAPDPGEDARNPDVQFALSNYYAVVNDPGQAIDHLELALQAGWTNYIWLKIHPDMEGLNADPRFQSLLARVLK